VTLIKAHRGDYAISTDPRSVDVEAVHAYLVRSYWAAGIPRALVAKSLASSLCFSLLKGAEQVGFARVVTDRATFAYLCDVYVLDEHRGLGLGTWLIERVAAHPDLQGLRRFTLATRDAHSLYAKFGFKPLGNPEMLMEIRVPDVYAATRNTPGG
jgi:GNAT superfamily N-acetyltransferase